MHASLVRIGLVIAGVVVVASASFAQHWPAFRGPAGAGIAEEQPLPPAWDAYRRRESSGRRPSPGWDTRARPCGAIGVRHDRGANRSQSRLQPEGQWHRPATDAVHEWRVLALDKSIGPILWSQTAHRGVPKVKRHVKATQANATPVTNGRVVVVSFGSEGLYAYDMDGKLLWKQDLGILDPGYCGPARAVVGIRQLADHSRGPGHPAVRHPEGFVHRRLQRRWIARVADRSR